MTPPSPPSPSAADAGRLQTAAASAGLLTILIGVPYALLTLLGNPWPQQVTSLADLGTRLAHPLGDRLAVQLLALAGWACWAAFATTMLREVLWYTTHLPNLVRDRAAHATHLDTVPALRLLAAVCIGGLVLALLGWLRPTPATAHPFGAEHPVAHGATAPLHPTGQQSDPPVPSVARYTVQAGDTLWHIAKHHLGDPFRWPEIYGLSKNLTQPDGRAGGASFGSLARRLTVPGDVGWGFQIEISPLTGLTTGVAKGSSVQGNADCFGECAVVE